MTIYINRRLWIAAAFLLLVQGGCCFSLYAQEEEVQEQAIEQKGERITAGDSSANYTRLQANINAILSSKYLKGTNYGLAIYSLDKKRMIFERNSHEALTPASTTKLFYTFAAMHTLGPSYQVPTTIYTDGTITKEGTLTGNLYVKGHGDCLLTVADIEQLADQIAHAGIKSINGDIIADGNYFDAMTDRQQYSGDAERMQDLPPVTSLGVNKNLVTVVVSAGAAGMPRVQTYPASEAFQIVYGGGKNEAPEAQTPPPSTKQRAAKTPKNFQGIINDVTLPKTEAKSSDTKVVPKITSPYLGKHAKPAAPKASKIAGAKQKSKSKKAAAPVRKKGKAAPAKKTKKAPAKKKGRAELFIPEYPEYGDGKAYGDFIIRRKPAAKAKGGKGGKKGAKTKKAKAAKVRLSVSSFVRQDGIQQFNVSGSPGKNATRSYTYEIKNPALTVAGILHRSLRANGVQIRGSIRNGSTPQSAKELTAFSRPLFDLIAPVNKNSDNYIAEHVMKIVGAHCCGGEKCNVNAYKTVSGIMDSAGVPLDGCMLYDGSGLSRRNKTSAATQLNLLKTIADQPYGGVFYSSLSVAGVEGTLHRRMRGTYAEANVHAKTGTHSNVSALSGYTRTRDGERIAFSMIWNGWSVGAYKQMENLIAIQLSEFSYTGGTVPAATVK